MSERWDGLVSKPRHLLRWLKHDFSFLDADCLMVVDSWDVLFVKSPDEIAKEWDAIGRPWICGAERNLFPPADTSAWPQCSSPYRFLNSGAIISTPKDMMAVLEAMNPDALPNDHQREDGSHHHQNDQQDYQQLFLKQPIPMLLDTECRFIWNLCDVHRDSADLLGEVINLDTKTKPGIIHANGGSKEGEIFLEILKSLEAKPDIQICTT